MAKIDTDFRLAFARMAPQAVISRSELASLLSTTQGAVSQMAYRGELPATAFPNKRRACWFVSDVRRWLDDLAAARPVLPQTMPKPDEKRIGRPRLSTNSVT